MLRGTSNSAATSTFIQSGTGAVTRTMQAKGREIVSVKDFGAVGDGITDDTAAVQAALVAGETNGRAVYAPAGTYLITSALVITKGIEFRGDGIASTVFSVGPLGAGVDVLRIVPSAAMLGLNLEGFRLTPAAGTPGRHGISIDITTYAVSNSSIHKVRVDQFGGRGIATLPNAVPLTDGFFTSSITDSVIYGGIYLDKAGDSLRILRNTITGTNVGVYADLVDTGSDGGAHSLEILGNNITSNGGSLLVKNAWTGRFSYNNCEVPAPSGLANNAVVDVDGTSGAVLTNNFTIEANFLSSGAGIDTVRLNYTRRCVVKDNYVTHGAGAYAYRVTANGLDNIITNNCDALDEAVSVLLADAGVRTTWFREFGGYIELRNHLWLQKADTGIYFTDSAGNKKKLISADATDDVCRIGYQDVPATNGLLLFFAGGTEKARIGVDGRFSVGGSGDASALLALQSTTKGFLLPQMTTAQKNAIAAPAEGLLVFDLTLGKACVSVGGGWQTITSV